MTNRGESPAVFPAGLSPRFVQCFKRYNKVSDGVVKTAAAAAGRTIKNVKKGEAIMCKFFDELQKEGERIGEIRGRAEAVKNMMADLGVTLEKACQLAAITPERYQEYIRTEK